MINNLCRNCNKKLDLRSTIKLLFLNKNQIKIKMKKSLKSLQRCSIIIYFIFLILACNFNLVATRRIPAAPDAELKEIILGDKLNLREKVPVFTRTYLTCNFENPVWYKNGEKLSVELRRKETIKFEKIKKTDAGIYSCLSGNEWSNVTLSVYPGGEIKSQISNDFPQNDQSSIQSYSQVAEQDDDQLQHNHDLDQDELDQGDLEDTTDHDETIDTIGVNLPKNANDSEEQNGSPPQFKSKGSLLRTIPKPSGSYIKLACAAIGNPQPNITWTRDDKPIVRQMGKVNYKKWTMFMEDAIPEDSGHYKCVVCNQYGCIEHITKLIIQDRVNHKPITQLGLSDQIILINKTIELKCKFLSDLHQEVGWVFIPCKTQDNCTEKKVLLNKTDTDRSDILKIENITHDDEGWYTCIAANSLGKSMSTAYLRVIDEEEIEEQPISLPVKNHSLYMTIFKITVGVLFLFGAIFILTIVRKMKHDKLMKHRMETVHQWTKKVIIYHPSGDPSSPETILMPIVKIEKQRTTLLQTSNCDPSPFNEYEFPLDSDWEIPRDQLRLSDTLGEGAFGRVIMAEAVNLSKSPKATIVAVKMVKEGHTDSDMASLVHEMEVMKMIGKHINIINLLGCCTQDGPLYVIVEYAPHGNLKDFLRKNNPTMARYINTKLLRADDDEKKFLTQKEKFFGGDDGERNYLTQKDLISFAYQIARGMEYLASRRCIHRDLAARNVLVSDDYILKIADFGLARDIQESEYYRRQSHGRLPIKWMAPESFKDKFYDSQSDVWSYGVLLWEIMTYGESPYPNIMTSDELYNVLMSGQRLDRPLSCSLNIYMLMRQCWNFDAHARPTFSELVENLDKILAATANANEEYLDLGVPMLDTPPSSDEESDTETLQETSFMRYHY